MKKNDATEIIKVIIPEGFETNKELCKLEQVSQLLTAAKIPNKLFNNYGGHDKYDQLMFLIDKMVYSICIDQLTGRDICFLAAIGELATGRGELPKNDIYYHYNYKEIHFAKRWQPEKFIKAINAYTQRLPELYNPVPDEYNVKRCTPNKKKKKLLKST